jgi:vacuolar-type H+-ATPase subunit H
MKDNPVSKPGLFVARTGGRRLNNTGSKTVVQIMPSSLDAIRRVEVEVSQGVAAARQDVQRVENEARDHALLITREAQAQGRQEGQQEFEAIVAQSRQEAEALLEEARQQSDVLRHKGASSMDAAVRRALAIVLGTDEEAP